MSARRTWSQSEDDKLTSLVARFGDKRGRESRWHEISKNLPGRTNKDCRKRWFHSLDPSLRKGRWAAEEVKLLLDAYKRLGPAWKEIATLIVGRKDDQCSKRYNDILSPSVKHRLEDWSPQEDRYLTAKVAELGNKWSVIATRLPGRPPLTCRNRWRKLARATRNNSRDGALSQSHVQLQSESNDLEPLSSTDTPMVTSSATSTSTSSSPEHLDTLYSLSRDIERPTIQNLASPNYNADPASPAAPLGGFGFAEADLQRLTTGTYNGTFPPSRNQTQNTASTRGNQSMQDATTPLDGYLTGGFLQALLNEEN
ncbi:Homeodomain-like protein [Aspergillus pseudoustus]|uniref:Homeodomain-like protein n=1 Tax=Aspergillus pseudoustus TaxID=1810923 RepID=A0ABR4JSY8_9EURO